MDMFSNRALKETPKSPTLRELVTPIFRRRKLLLISFVSVFTIVVALGFLVPRPYKAQMEVLVNRERLDPPVTPEATTQVPTDSAAEVTVEDINSEAGLLLSRDVLQNVARQTGLDHPQPSLLAYILPKRTYAQNLAHAAERLAKQIKVETETNSNLIHVSYKSSDPERSYAVLHALQNLYLDKHEAVHRPAGSYELFDTETQKYRDALQRAEDQLLEFSQKAGVAAPDVERTNIANQVALAIGQLHNAEEAVAADKERLAADQSQLGFTPARSETARQSAAADKLLDDLRATLLAARTKRLQLTMKYDAQYPLVKETDAEIAITEAAITQAEKTTYQTSTTDRDPTYELIREDIAKTKSDLSAQQATVVAVRRSIGDMQAQMVSLNAQAIKEQDLQREVKANEGSYLLYLSKREQERTTDALDKRGIENVAIAVPPVVPVLPVYGNTMVLLAAFGLACIVSTAAAYSVDLLDSSIHTPAQAADILGIPTVISVAKRTA